MRNKKIFTIPIIIIFMILFSGCVGLDADAVHINASLAIIITVEAPSILDMVDLLIIRNEGDKIAEDTWNQIGSDTLESDYPISITGDYNIVVSILTEDSPSSKRHIEKIKITEEHDGTVIGPIEFNFSH